MSMQVLDQAKLNVDINSCHSVFFKKCLWSHRMQTSQYVCVFSSLKVDKSVLLSVEKVKDLHGTNDKLTLNFDMNQMSRWEFSP